jgi:hypothetical protein
VPFADGGCTIVASYPQKGDYSGTSKWLPPVIYDDYRVDIISGIENRIYWLRYNFRGRNSDSRDERGGRKMRSLPVATVSFVFVFGTTIATDSTIVYYYRSPGHHKQFRRAHSQRQIPVWGSIPNDVQILLAA